MEQSHEELGEVENIIISASITCTVVKNQRVPLFELVNCNVNRLRSRPMCESVGRLSVKVHVLYSDVDSSLIKNPLEVTDKFSQFEDEILSQASRDDFNVCRRTF